MFFTPHHVVDVSTTTKEITSATMVSKATIISEVVVAIM
jgi:hypothetical protein